MRRVPLKKVEFRMYGSPQEAPPLTFDYGDTIMAIINSSAVDRGTTVGEISRQLRLVQAVDAARQSSADHVDIEDADWTTLTKLVDEFSGYRIVHDVIVRFAQEIRDAKAPPRVEPEKPVDPPTLKE